MDVSKSSPKIAKAKNTFVGETIDQENRPPLLNAVATVEKKIERSDSKPERHELGLGIKNVKMSVELSIR